MIDVARDLARERDASVLLERILFAAREACGADGGSIYVVDLPARRIDIAVATCETLGLHLGGSGGRAVDFASPALFDTDGAPNHAAVITHCVHERRTIHLADAYEVEGRHFSGPREFDARYGYRTRSVLTVPMIDHEDQVIGVLQLINAGYREGSARTFSTDEVRFIEALSAQAGIAIEKQRLIERLERLFESLVAMINDAIDEKSPYTGGHCRRVPQLTMMLAEAAHRTQKGPLARFEMTERDRRELWLAGMLHDCGKITTPVHVVDKATKLSTIFDRIALVEARFEIAARDARIAMLERVAAGESREQAQRDLDEVLVTLDDEREFLALANLGSERMADADIERVHRIARRRWRDGNGVEQPLLSDDEVANLTIAYGTLTAEERTVINRHIDATIRMLEALPWPRDYQRVPEYAGGHHERMDGKGYPRGLTREQMSWQARMMAIADIFEALTAGDRPYKSAKTLSESLAILGGMKLRQHIDPDLFDVFVRERVYLEYARKFLPPEQIDTVNEAAIPGYPQGDATPA